MNTSNKHTNQNDATEARKHFMEIVSKCNTAMLVTRSDKFDHARPMAIADVTADGDLWFATGADTAKVTEIRRDRRVLVAIQANNQFVSVTGHASVIHDPKKAAELWSEGFRVWFTGKDDPNLTLIHVAAEEAEYWDISGLAGVRVLFNAAASIISGKPLGERLEDTDVERHAKLHL